METALKNQEEANKRKNTDNRQLMEGQILFSNFVHDHSLPSSSFTWFVDLAARIFPDSNIARRWSGYKDGMRKKKGDYFLTHWVYDFHHQNLINTLETTFFSINIDESSVNRKSLLDVNVSFIDTEKKESLEKGTTAVEIVDTIVERVWCFLHTFEEDCHYRHWWLLNNVRRGRWSTSCTQAKNSSPSSLGGM
jgi:hypothetical protein